MEKPRTQADVLKVLAREKGVLRARDLAPRKIPRMVLTRLCNKGELIRTSRGLYVAGYDQFTENHSLAEVARMAPQAVVCLLSALQFHGLSTHMPADVWIAIGPKARPPRHRAIPIRALHFSAAALSEGIERHRVENVSVRIYSTAKTVADCFKYRNKIGLDVAMEALRECWRKRKTTADDLWRYAKICRVARVMQPYLETLHWLSPRSSARNRQSNDRDRRFQCPPF